MIAEKNNERPLQGTALVRDRRALHRSLLLPRPHEQSEASSAWTNEPESCKLKLFVCYPLPCALIHPGSPLEILPEPDGTPPGCPDCGCLLDTGSCWFCGMEFLIFGSDSYDDVINNASVTSSGDLMCARCASEAEREELENDNEWGEDDLGVGF